MRAWMANALDVVAVGVSLPDAAFWDQLHALMHTIPCLAEVPEPTVETTAAGGHVPCAVVPAEFHEWTVMPITRAFFGRDARFLRFADRALAMGAAAATGGHVADTSVMAIPLPRLVRALGQFLLLRSSTATTTPGYSLAPVMLWLLEYEPAIFAEWIASFMDRGDGARACTVSARARDRDMWWFFGRYLCTSVRDPERAWVLLNLFIDDSLDMSVRNSSALPAFLRHFCSRKETSDGRLRVTNKHKFWWHFLMTPVEAIDIQVHSPRVPGPRNRSSNATTAAAAVVDPASAADHDGQGHRALLMRGQSCQCPHRVVMGYKHRDMADQLALKQGLPAAMTAQQAATLIAKGAACAGGCASASAAVPDARRPVRLGVKIRDHAGTATLGLMGRDVAVACSGQPGRFHGYAEASTSKRILVAPALWEAVHDAEMRAWGCRDAVTRPVTETWELTQYAPGGVEAVSFARDCVPPFPLSSSGDVTLDRVCPVATSQPGQLNLDSLDLMVQDYARPENDCMCAIALVEYDARDHTAQMTRSDGQQWYERYTYAESGAHELLSKSERAQAVLRGCAAKKRG